MFLRYNQLSIIWTIIVFFFCVIPAKQIPDPEIPGFDKVVHFIMFFMLSYLWTIGLIKQHSYKSLQKKAIFIAMLSSFLFGIFTELFQYLLTESRSGELNDLLADVLGVIGSYFFFKIIYGKIDDYAS